MNRPLLVTDCDEVLMHMVVPFADWLAEDHGIDFHLHDTGFANALRRRACGTVLPSEDVWPLLDGFFRHQMHRQYAVEGAAAGLAAIADHADIVVLTNVGPDHQVARQAQLDALAMAYPVIGSRGGKGDPLARIVAETQPSMVLFVDDLAIHHASVARAVPHSWRLHMVAEPAIAEKIETAQAAHVRIDDWAQATQWLLDRITSGETAPILETPHD